MYLTSFNTLYGTSPLKVSSLLPKALLANLDWRLLTNEYFKAYLNYVPTGWPKTVHVYFLLITLPLECKASKPITIPWIITSTQSYWKKTCIASYYRKFTTYIKVKETRLKPILLVRVCHPLGINKTSFNLVISHFHIREKLSIIRCDKKYLQKYRKPNVLKFGYFKGFFL